MTAPSHDNRKRNQILNSAAALFSQRGFGKTSIRFLADEAQVSTSTIYSYFSDKNDLLLQSIDHRLSLIETKVLEATEQDGEPVAALANILSIIHKALKNDPFIRKIITFDPHVVDHRLHERAKLARDRIRQLAITGLLDAEHSKHLDCEDVEALESVCRLAFQGWLLSVENGSEEVSEERFTNMLVYLIEGRCQ